MHGENSSYKKKIQRRASGAPCMARIVPTKKILKEDGFRV
jgi:hypothetical protein